MDYGYSNPWGMALQQPMGGLMSPFTPWGLGAVGEPVQPQEAMATRGVRSMDRREESGESPGFSTPDDPSKAAQTSQATRDRLSDGLMGGFGIAAGKTALGTGAALAAGMPAGMIGQAAIGGLASPGTLGGVLGRSIDSALGTTQRGFLGKAMSSIPGIGLGMALGPMGGLLGGMFGGVVADGAVDAMNARNEESLRDDMENKAGYFGGRVGFADMQSYADKANALNDKVADAIAKATAVANIAGVPAPSFNRRDVSTRGMEVGDPGSRSYGGWGNVGGPAGGARSVDRGYGPSMGGFAGLGIGNPSSYGGKSSGSSSSGGKSSGGGSSSGGGYGGHAGGKDGSSSGFGR